MHSARNVRSVSALRDTARRARADHRSARARISRLVDTARADSSVSARLSGSSRRPATSRVSSIRIALGGSVANTGRSSSTMRSRPSGLRVVARRQHSLDAKAHERHRLLHRRARSPRGPSRCTSSAGSIPPGRLTTRSSRRRRAASCEARSIASWPAVSASSASSTVVAIRDELPHLLGRQRGAHQTHGVGHPRLVHRDHVGVALAQDHAARRAPRGRGRGRRRRGGGPCGRRRCRRCSGTSVSAPPAARAPRSPAPCPRVSASGNMIRARKRSYTRPRSLRGALHEAGRIQLLLGEARPQRGAQHAIPRARAHSPTRNARSVSSRRPRPTRYSRASAASGDSHRQRS